MYLLRQLSDQLRRVLVRVRVLTQLVDRHVRGERVEQLVERSVHGIAVEVEEALEKVLLLLVEAAVGGTETLPDLRLCGGGGAGLLPPTGGTNDEGTGGRHDGPGWCGVGRRPPG